MTTLLTVVAEMKAKPGKEKELRAAALALIEPTRKEEGCIQYDLHVHAADPGRFVFYENWVSAEHLARHSQSDHLKAFGAKAAEFLDGPAQVETYTRIA